MKKIAKKKHFSWCCSAEKQHVFFEILDRRSTAKTYFGMLLSFENGKCLNWRKRHYLRYVWNAFFYKTRVSFEGPENCNLFAVCI